MTGVTTPITYGAVLAGNIAAARVRLRMHQRDLAERMTALAWKWSKQTVSELEAGRRAIRGDELLGLALALETSVPVLVTAPIGMTTVTVPAGALVGTRRIVDPSDGTVTWDGNRPKVAAGR